jgi:hypothetical protein
MNVVVPSELYDVVLDFAEQRKIFTAYDVTIEARKRAGNNVYISPSEGRNAVQEHFQGGVMGYEYKGTLVDLPHGKITVYHPNDKSPTDHPTVSGVGISEETEIVAEVKENVTEEAQEAIYGCGIDPISVTVRSGKTISVPVKLLKRVSAKSYQKSYIICIEGKSNVYHPNQEGRIRLNLSSYDVKIGDIVNITVDNQYKINLELVPIDEEQVTMV